MAFVTRAPIALRHSCKAEGKTERPHNIELPPKNVNTPLLGEPFALCVTS